MHIIVFFYVERRILITKSPKNTNLKDTMKKIGLLSDTHGYWDASIRDFLGSCDEIWHAGDIGTIELLDEMKAFKPLKGVYGNIDNYKIRQDLQKVEIFQIEKVKIIMTHIGGYPGRYEKGIEKLLQYEHPKLFISGHSHILKVIFDKKNQLLHMNPGAAGKSGFHKVRTALRFIISEDQIRDLEVLELQRK
jgi:hypothetical protein